MDTNESNETKQKNNDKFVVLATKVSPAFARIFITICRRKGIKPYQALRMMVDSFVRYTDDRHNLSSDMERLMMVFEHAVGWENAFNIADPRADKQIEEAVYFLSAKERTGMRAVMVQRPFFGNWQETYNLQLIIERMMEVLSPERYRRLRLLAVEHDCSSILELIDKLIDTFSKDADTKAYREEFEQNDFSEFGKQPSDEHYKRKHYTNPDLFAQAEERRKKADESSQWLNDNTDFRPHGGEW